MAPESAEIQAGAPSGTAEWIAYRERGSPRLMRVMVFLSRRLGRSASHLVLYPIVAYFFLFAPSVGRHSRAYLRRVFGREPRWLERFRHLLAFASTVHDRIYLFGGDFDEFAIDIEGDVHVKGVLAGSRAPLLMGAHAGSFEVIGSVARQDPGLRVAMTMYEENARKTNAMLRAINPAAVPEIIGLGHLGSMLRVRERLDQGVLVGVLGDRSLGDEPGQMVSFLDAPARFPTGPMRMAALLRCRVVFMLGLYRGRNRYQVIFAPLADFSETSADEREAAITTAIGRYAALLERYCRQDPYNWFNFFDFWRS